MFVDAKGWEDLTKFGAFKNTAMGAIVGAIYYYAYMSYSLPNQFMCIVAGYSGADFLIKMVEKVRKEEPQ